MPEFTVFISEPAERDLQGIALYIARDLQALEAARRQLQRLREAVLSLADYPTRHPLVADQTLAEQGYRMVAVNNYLVFYLMSEKQQTVTVIRVLHSRRDWLSFL